MSDKQASFHTSTSHARVKHKPSRPLPVAERKEKQAKFLEAYREVGIVKVACAYAEIDRRTYYNWKEGDAEFQAQLSDARADAFDTLEHAAYSQAVEGMEEPAVSMGRLVYEEEPVLDADGEPVYDKGKLVTKRGKLITIKKYSPQLLITLLKANMPEKYRERTQVEHSGPGGGPIQIQRNPNLKNLSDEELDALENIARKASGEGGSDGNA